MRRWLWRSSLLLLGPPLCWVIAALTLGAIPTGSTQFEPGGIPIYVVSNGYHVSFVLPVAAEGVDWRDTFGPEHFPSEIRNFPFVAFGWGERQVYMETPTIDDLDLGAGARAIFMLSTTVAHVLYTDQPPDTGEGRRLVLSPQRYKALAAYISEAFARNAQGRPILIPGRGFASSDAFYEGVGRYSFISTCNEWVGRGLRRIGAPTGLWTPLSYQVLSHLE